MRAGSELAGYEVGCHERPLATMAETEAVDWGPGRSDFGGGLHLS